jgi:hypothetical protein
MSKQSRPTELPDLELRSRAYHHRRAAAREPDAGTRQMHLVLAAEFQRIADRQHPVQQHPRRWIAGGGHRPGALAQVIVLSEARARRERAARSRGAGDPATLRR